MSLASWVYSDIGLTTFLTRLRGLEIQGSGCSQHLGPLPFIAPPSARSPLAFVSIINCYGRFISRFTDICKIPNICILTYNLCCAIKPAMAVRMVLAELLEERERSLYWLAKQMGTDYATMHKFK